MARSVALTNLITWVRQRADDVNNPSFTDTELTAYINLSRTKLHSIMASSHPNLLKVSSATITTVANQTLYGTSDGFPSDFFCLVALQGLIGGRNVLFKQFSPGDRPVISYAAVPGGIVCTLYYIPACVDMGDGTGGTITADDYVNGWEEYIICDVAAMMKEKEEGDPAPFLARRDAEFGRIMQDAVTRSYAGTVTMDEELWMNDESDGSLAYIQQYHPRYLIYGGSQLELRWGPNYAS